jgi:hypothetical protein
LAHSFAFDDATTAQSVIFMEGIFVDSVAKLFINYVQTIGVGAVDQTRHLKWRTDTAVVDRETTQRRVGSERQKQRGKGPQRGIARWVAIVHTASVSVVRLKKPFYFTTATNTRLSPHTVPVQP